jgi:NAD-dependent SIR2 family protein deacetylase
VLIRPCSFDLNVFDSDPSLFYSTCPVLFRHFAQCSPSFTHRFLAHLSHLHKLQRLYTQNVDGLEAIAGVDASVLLPCHGSLATFRCRKPKCPHRVSTLDILPLLLGSEDGTTPPAGILECGRPPAARTVEIESDFGGEVDLSAFGAVKKAPRGCRGIMKPEITFFGETLPIEYDHTVLPDLTQADLFIAIGTSMRVRPAGGMLEGLRRDVPCLLINAEPVKTVTGGMFDLSLIGQCDVICAALAQKLPGFREAHSLRSGPCAATPLRAPQAERGSRMTVWSFLHGSPAASEPSAKRPKLEAAPVTEGRMPSGSSPEMEVPGQGTVASLIAAPSEGLDEALAVSAPSAAEEPPKGLIGRSSSAPVVSSATPVRRSSRAIKRPRAVHSPSTALRMATDRLSKALGEAKATVSSAVARIHSVEDMKPMHFAIEPPGNVVRVEFAE